MTRHEQTGLRPLKFGVLKDAFLESRSSDGYAADSDSEPSLEHDYRPVEFSDFVGEDFAGALVMFDPTYLCNMRCPFCALPVTSRTKVDFERIKSVFRALRLGGAENLVLTGGEPGIVPEFEAITRFAADLGFRVSVLTNGTWAKNAETSERIVRAGISEIVFSLKGASAETCDRLSGGKFFDRQMRALSVFSDLRKSGVLESLVVNHVVCGNSLEDFIRRPHLDDRLEMATMLIALVEPYRREMVSLVPDPAQLRDQLAALTARWSGRGIPVVFEGLPHCLLGANARNSRDRGRARDRRPRVLVRPRADADYALYYRGYQRQAQFTHVPACSTCMVRDECPGIHKKLVRQWAGKAIAPLRAHEIAAK